MVSTSNTFKVVGIVTNIEFTLVKDVIIVEVKSNRCEDTFKVKMKNMSMFDINTIQSSDAIAIEGELTIFENELMLNGWKYITIKEDK